MLTTIIRPRFCDTDALGHINNTVIPVWFLEAREGILRLFMEGDDAKRVPLAVVRTEIDYLAEIYFGKEVTARTGVLRIGNSSFALGQTLWQENLCCARGITTLVRFNTATRKSAPIAQSIHDALKTHWISAKDWEEGGPGRRADNAMD